MSVTRFTLNVAAVLLAVFQLVMLLLMAFGVVTPESWWKEVLLSIVVAWLVYETTAVEVKLEDKK